MPGLASLAIGLEKFTTFGDLLRYLRRRTGLTQRELSIAVGYSDTQISRLEQNQRLPDLATIAARFISALGLEDEPATAKRLMELAASVRLEDAPASGSPPYKGLRYFDEGDADLFFGREALTLKLLDRILGQEDNRDGGAPWRCLGIVGASGSGKSSVVRAGLVHALRWNARSSSWPVLIMTPTAHPLEALANAFSRQFEPVIGTASLTELLQNDTRALSLHARRQLQAGQQDVRLLLVVDQFEELFTLCRDESERRAFIGNLMAAAASPSSADEREAAFVVLTLRADFYAHCAPYEDLRRALAGQQEYIGPMTAKEIQRAIEEPARRGGWELEPGLVELLLQDIGAEGPRAPEPGALPLLSHVLLETWRRRRGRTLTLSGYLASGGVRGAIAETADALFHDQLDTREQAIARNIFLRLTELGGSELAIGTRRRASIDELIAKPDEAPAVRSVLTKLADARLITTDQNVVEVAHEVLLREWPTLRDWLDENREGLQRHRHLTQAAEEWARRDREASELYRGARLAQMLEWAAWSDQAGMMNALEREFLQTSQALAEGEAAEREEQRQRELDAAQKLAQTEGARAKSEARRAEEQVRYVARVRTRNRAIAAAGGVALMLALLAAVFGWQSNQNAARAERNLGAAHIANTQSAASAATAQAASTSAVAEARKAATQETAANENFQQADGQRLGAQAYALVQAPGGDAELAALLSLRGLQAAYSPQADAALSQSLARLFTRHVLVGHTNSVNGGAFSPDGRYVATASFDKTARLWDTETGREVRVFRGHTEPVWSVAFSRDGQYLLTGGEDSAARMWDVETGQEVHRFDHPPSTWVISVEFSPDGRQALTASLGGGAILWDIQSGQPIRRFDNAVATFSSDGLLILTSTVNGAPQLWDWQTGQVVRQFDTTGLGVLSPDGRLMLAGAGNTVRLFQTETGQELRAVTDPHGRDFRGTAFSPDGGYILTGGEDHVARLWDVATGQEVRAFVGHTDVVFSVAFSPDGTSVLTTSWDGTARLWYTGPETQPRAFANPLAAVSASGLSPDGRYVLLGFDDGTLSLRDVQQNREIRQLIGHTAAVRDVAFLRDGQHVLTGGDDQTARLWDVETGDALLTLPHASTVFAVAASADGQHVLTNDGDEGAILWDATTGSRQRAFTYPGLADLALSPDGHAILTSRRQVGGALAPLVLWSDRTGALLRSFVGHTDAVNAVAFSPDGKYLLSGSSDRSVRLWEVESGRQVQLFTGHADEVLAVAFSPDGQYALSGGRDGMAWLWSIATGEQLRVIAGHSQAITGLDFSPNATSVLTTSQDGTARLWDVDYHAAMRYLCSHLDRDFTNDERRQYSLHDDEPTCPGR